MTGPPLVRGVEGGLVGLPWTVVGTLGLRVGGLGSRDRLESDWVLSPGNLSVSF